MIDYIQIDGIGRVVVSILNLNGIWQAEGVDYDHSATGATLEEARNLFCSSLTECVREQVAQFGHAKRLLRAV